MRANLFGGAKVPSKAMDIPREIQEGGHQIRMGSLQRGLESSEERDIQGLRDGCAAGWEINQAAQLLSDHRVVVEGR